MDIEYLRIPNESKNETAVIKTIIEIFISYCNHTFGIEVSSNDVITMTSSDVLKISYHIIFSKVIFESNFKCKLFVQSVLDSLSPNILDTFSALDMQMKKKMIIDMSVYSKNQNFRLFLSSKFGKNTPLMIDYKHTKAYCSFFDTLISSKDLLVNAVDHNSILYDEKETKHASKPNDIETQWPSLDKLVKCQLSDKGTISNTKIYFNQKNTNDPMILYNIKNFNYCANVKRWVTMQQNPNL